MDRLEIEANTFAVELLLTDEMISAYKDTRLSIQEVAEIYGIPGGFARLKPIFVKKADAILLTYGGLIMKKYLVPFTALFYLLD